VEGRCGVEVDEDVDDGIFGPSQPEEETFAPFPSGQRLPQP
jgi:hypothetical protein